MRLLFITAHKYLPQMRGGLQTSTNELCLALAARGHNVAVLAGLMPGSFFAAKCRVKMKINRKVRGCQVTRDAALPYPVWYSWFPWEAVSYVVQKEKPTRIWLVSVFFFNPSSWHKPRCVARNLYPSSLNFADAHSRPLWEK